MPRIQDCLSLGKRPYIPAEGTVFLPDFPETPGVMDDGLHLSPGTDHPFRCKDTLHVPIPVSSHLIIVKPVKTLPEDFPFLYHHVPVQAALHDLHHEKFKLPVIVMEGDAPLLIVVSGHFFIAKAPWTAFHTIFPLWFMVYLRSGFMYTTTLSLYRHTCNNTRKQRIKRQRK